MINIRKTRWKRKCSTQPEDANPHRRKQSKPRSSARLPPSIVTDLTTRYLLRLIANPIYLRDAIADLAHHEAEQDVRIEVRNMTRDLKRAVRDGKLTDTEAETFLNGLRWSDKGTILIYCMIDRLTVATGHFFATGVEARRL